MQNEPMDIYKKTRNIFIVDLSVVYTIGALCSGGFLAALLRYAGFTDQINGLISSIPYGAAVFQLIGAALVGLSSNKKHFIILGVSIHRLSLALIYFIPLFGNNNSFQQVLIIVFFSLAYIANSLISPEISTWLMNSTPSRMRSQYFSTREQLSLIYVATITIVASFIMDRFSEKGAYKIAFAIIGMIILVNSIVNIMSLSKGLFPEHQQDIKKITRKSLVQPIRDRKFHKVLVVLILWQVAFQVWQPFAGIYLINDLNVSYSLLGIVAVICSFEKAFAVKLWGRLLSRMSWSKALFYAMIFYIAATLMFFSLNEQNASWLYVAHSIVANIAWSVLGISLTNIQYENADPAQMPSYIGFAAAISGIIGFMAATAGAFLYSFINNKDLIVNGMQSLCLISVVTSTSMCIFIHFRFKHKTQAEAEEVPG